MTNGQSTTDERTFECENCGAKYNTHGRHCPLRSCYECGERHPWTLVTDSNDDHTGEN